MADRPEWVPEPPPNLRKSGDDGKECEVCTHYQSGECARYLYRTEDGTARLPVDEDWVCDGFAPSGRTDADPDDQPKSLAEAKIRVREHFRRRREQQ